MENLEELVAAHQGSLFAFLYRMCGDADVAEDLMQETFVRALRAAGRFRPQAEVRTWLFSIATNLVKDRWRREARRGPEVSLHESMVAANDLPEQVVLEKLGQDEVRQALLQLPLPYRSTLVLRYYHDLTYAQIARVLFCPLGTVRSRIHNGLARLKQILMGTEGVQP